MDDIYSHLKMPKEVRKNLLERHEDLKKELMRAASSYFNTLPTKMSKSGSFVLGNHTTGEVIVYTTRESSKGMLDKLGIKKPFQTRTTGRQ